MLLTLVDNNELIVQTCCSIQEHITVNQLNAVIPNKCSLEVIECFTRLATGYRTRQMDIQGYVGTFIGHKAIQGHLKDYLRLYRDL